jgi:hypothetical protein
MVCLGREITIQIWLLLVANRCYLCRISTALKNDNNNNKESIEPFEEIIDSVKYAFDNIECALIFKKLKIYIYIRICIKVFSYLQQKVNK